MEEITRRDFLKIATSLAANAIIPSKNNHIDAILNADNRKPNFIVILLDALSARHLSISGYGRETTPNLQKFAEKCTVYHSHFSNGSFTVSGVASLLMGMYPWKHRAINFDGLVKRSLIGQNIFALLEDYFRVGYSQNYFSNMFLYQFQKGIDSIIPIETFSYKPIKLHVSRYFQRDSISSYYALDNFVLKKDKNPVSMLLGYLDALSRPMINDKKSFLDEYPYGLPHNFGYQYLNPIVYDGISKVIGKLSNQTKQYFAFFHLYSPHEPYSPRRSFVDSLNEIDVVFKPFHRLSSNHTKKKELDLIRKTYDEYIADVDFELGNLLDYLDTNGVLDNTYIIITSDHGELFERGENGHITRLLFDPVIRIPLIVMAPDQVKGKNIYTPTSSVDILPTILYLAGEDVPEGIDGMVLPGLGGKEYIDRSIYSMDAKDNSAFAPFKKSTISLIKGNNKLVYYQGYEKFDDMFELYNLQDDIEEKKNLFAKDTLTSAVLKDELLSDLESANRKYNKNKLPREE